MTEVQGEMEKSLGWNCIVTLLFRCSGQMVKMVAFSGIHLKSYIDSALILMKETAIWSIINVLGKQESNQTMKCI